MKNFCIILIVALLAGCAGGGDVSKKRGKLSEGMKKASKENEKDRRVHTSYNRENNDSDIFVSFHDEDDDEGGIVLSDIFDRSRFVTRFSTGLTKNNDFYGFQDFSLGLSGEIFRRNYWSLFLEAEYSPVQETSQLNASIENGVTILKVGFQWDIHTTGDYSFLGNYFLWGFDIDFMSWKYKNPIIAWDDYGNEETISEDWLQGLEIFTGIGFTIMNPYKIQLGAEVVPGIILWGWNTYEGFENDVFDPFLFIKLRLVLNFDF
jgi:hypothetical protein